MKNIKVIGILISAIAIAGLGGCAQETTSVKPSELINSISGSLALKGTYTYGQSNEHEMFIDVYSHTDIISYVSDDHFYNKKDDVVNEYFLGNDDKTIYRYLNPVTNQFGYDYHYSSYLKTEEYLEKFSEKYANPLSLISEENLTSSTSLSSRFFIPLDIRQKIGYVFTLDEDFSPSHLIIRHDEKGSPTHIVLKNSEWGYGYTMYYLELEIIDEDEIPFTNYLTREKNEYTEKLGELFTDLSKNNYTVETTIIDNIEQTVETYSAKSSESGYLVEHDDKVSGYLQMSDSLYAPVILNKDNKLQTTTPEEEGKVAEIATLPTFNYLDYMFEITNYGRTFNLPNVNGFYDYPSILEIIPSKPYNENIDIDQGSLNITYNFDGTYTFSYKITNVNNGLYNRDLTVESVISKVGETTLGYSLSDYLEYSYPTSWSDVSEANELFEKREMTSTYIPFIDLEGIVWKVDLERNSIIAHSIPSTITIDEMVDRFETLLFADGWIKEEDNYYTKSDSQSKTTYSFYLQTDSSDNSFRIVLYYPSYETALSNWINEKFTNEINYTISGNINLIRYTINPLTGEKEDYYPIEFAFESRATNDAYYQYFRFGLNHPQAYINSGSNSYYYEQDHAVWSQLETHEATYKDILFTMHDLIDHDYYKQVEEDPSSYTTDNTITCAYYTSLINYDFDKSYNIIEDVNLTFNEANSTLKFETTNYRAHFTYEDELTLVEFKTDLTISNVGSTTMDDLDLPTL